MTTSANVFGVLAGVLLGLAIASARQRPQRPVGRAGVIALFSATAGVTLLVPAVSDRIDARVFEATDLAAAGPLLARLLLMLAVTCWCIHLLDLVAAGIQTIRAAAALSAVAAVVLIWQWTTLAEPAGVIAADARWYGLAFAAGVGIPQLLVLFTASATRGRTTGSWPTVLMVAAAAGVLWCAWRIAEIFAAGSVAALPGVITWALIGLSAVGSWWASVDARTERGSAVDELAEEGQIREHEADDTDDDDLREPIAATGPVAYAPERDEPEPEPTPEPEPPVDPEEAKERATALAVALAGQLDLVGFGTAVSVGIAGNEAIFVTAEGLGHLPEDGAGTDNLVPLISRVPERFVNDWLGHAHPQIPLLAAEEQGHTGPLAAVATVGPGGTIDPEDLEGMEKAPLTLPRSNTDAVPVSQILTRLAQLRKEWSIESGGDAVKLTEQVVAARWTTEPNSEYAPLWVSELAARATDALERGDVDSATYCLASALRIPNPNRPHTNGAHTAAASTDQTHQAIDQLPAAPRPATRPTPAAMPEPVTANTASTPTRPTQIAAIGAALATEIPDSAAFAIALTADGTAFFATSDGLGYLPADARASASVIPLAALVPVDFATQWLGCDLPHKPLLAAIAAGLIPPAIELATTNSGVTDIDVITLTEQVLRSAPPIALTTARDAFDPATIDDIDQAVADLEVALGPAQPDIEGARVTAEALRWTTAPDPRYALAWAKYLQSEAAVAPEPGDLRYLLGNAELALGAAERGTGSVSR